MAPKPLVCDEALLAKDLKDKVAIVTGANSGCGVEIARQLVSQGACVVLACRRQPEGEGAAAEVGGVFMRLDLADLESVREFVKEFKSKYTRLDFLVNNAGIMACPLWRTKQNFEMQFGTNHLGHFLLTSLLKDYLEKSVPSRVVCVSSCAAAQTSIGGDMADVDFDDLNWEKRKYDRGAAYAQSKLANVLHASEVAKRYKGVTATSCHPGWIDSPLKQHVVGGCMGNLFTLIFRDCTGDMIVPKNGAQTALHCCLADDIENGAFYSQFGLYKDKASQAGGWPMTLPNPNNTVANAARMWDESEKLVNCS